jgi:hypothetical protein
MEASGASPAGNGQGGDAGPAEGQGQGFDPGQISETLQGLQGSQEQLRQQFSDFMEQQPWQQQEQEPGEPEPDPSMDLSFLGDPMLAPEQQAERLTQAFDQRVEQRAQQMLEQQLSPLREGLDEMRLERGAEQLVSEFPEMADPQVANEVVQAAHQYADLLGQPELASNTALWRLVYMAGRAADMHSQEGADAPGAAHLEGGAGAAPGGSQVDLGDLIVNGGGQDAALGKRVLPFG